MNAEQYTTDSSPYFNTNVCDYTPKRERQVSKVENRDASFLPLPEAKTVVTPQANNFERRDLPSPPKTAFMLYCEANTNGDKEPDLNLLAAGWRDLSPEDKDSWNRKANNDKVRYNRERMNFVPTANSLPKRRAKKHPLAPKRPMSAFLKFSISRRSDLKAENPDMNNTDISRLLGEMWRNAPEEEKKPYRLIELKERTLYNKEIKRWRLIQQKKEMEIELIEAKLAHPADRSSHGYKEPAINLPEPYAFHDSPFQQPSYPHIQEGTEEFGHEHHSGNRPVIDNHRMMNNPHQFHNPRGDLDENYNRYYQDQCAPYYDGRGFHFENVQSHSYYTPTEGSTIDTGRDTQYYYEDGRFQANRIDDRFSTHDKRTDLATHFQDNNQYQYYHDNQSERKRCDWSNYQQQYH